MSNLDWIEDAPNNMLELLPTRTIKAKVIGKNKFVDVIVDGDYDGEYIAGYTWRVLPSGYVVMHTYTETLIDSKTGESLGSEQRKMTYLHHVVLPRKEGMWTKHINGNKLDNRSANLRYMSPQESAVTRKVRESGTYYTKTGDLAGVNSKYRGVRRMCNTVNGKLYISPTRFVVSISSKYIGSYPDEITAAKAYDKAAIAKWGNDAPVNFKESHGERDN